MGLKKNIILPDCCYRVSVKLLIQNEEGKYLLLKHPADQYWNHEWWFIGGGLEFNETPEICGKREFQEESGVKLLSFISEPQLFLTAKSFRHNYHTAQIFYSAQAPNTIESIIPREWIAFKYFSLQDMENLLLWHWEKKFLEVIKKRWKIW